VRLITNVTIPTNQIITHIDAICKIDGKHIRSMIQRDIAQVLWCRIATYGKMPSADIVGAYDDIHRRASEDIVFAWQ
jgi:hypothetical protein